MGNFGGRTGGANEYEKVKLIARERVYGAK